MVTTNKDGMLKTFMTKYNITNYNIAGLILLFGIYFVYIKYMESWIITRETINIYSKVRLR